MLTLERRGTPSGTNRRSTGDRGSREEERQSSGNEGEGEAFGEELGEDLRAARAEGAPQGELAPSSLGPDQEDVGHVHAGHQEHEADRPRKDEKGAPDVSHHLVQERRDERHELGAREDRSGKLLGKLRDEIGGDCPKLAQGRFDRGTFFQPRERSVAELTQTLGPGIELERNPNVDIFEREGEAPREDAYDLPTGSVDLDRAFEDSRVRAQTAAPESLAHQDHLGSPLLLVVLGERAPEEWIHSRESEERRGDRALADSIGGIEPGQAHPPVPHERALGEGGDALPVAKIQGHRGVHVVQVEPRGRVAHVDQLPGVRIGKRRQENAVHQGEDRDGEPDPAGEGQNGERGETFLDRETLEDRGERDHPGIIDAGRPQTFGRSASRPALRPEDSQLPTWSRFWTSKTPKVERAMISAFRLSTSERTAPVKATRPRSTTM